MRTLFFRPHRRWRQSLRLALSGLLFLVFLAGVFVTMAGLLGRPAHTVELVAAALLALLLALAGVWQYKRRMQTDSRKLQDSAMW